MARASLATLVAALSLAACGGGGGNDMPDAAAPDCGAVFSGNFSDDWISASTPCSSFGPLADGVDGLTLTLDSKVQGAPTHISIETGSVSEGETFSSETVANWSAQGINTNDCQFSAGNQSVPAGSFNLTILGAAGDDAGTVVHGYLTVTQYVLAPPTVDCGPGDTETIQVTF